MLPKKQKIELTEKIKFNIKLIFSTTHEAITTVLAENKEEAYLLARKKYSNRTIQDLIFLKTPEKVKII